MSTIRVAKRQRFTTVDRRAVNDERLSFRARGVLVWLLDKPDDWRFSSETLAAQAPEGRTAIRSALKELREAGYLRTTKYRDEHGRFHTEQVLHETPMSDSPEVAEVRFPDVGKPAVGLPDVGEPVLLLNTEEPKTETETPTPKARERDLLFEAVCEVTGIDPARLAPRTRGALNGVLRELRTVNASPEQVHMAARVYRKRWPNVTLTAQALVKHWPTLFGDAPAGPAWDAQAEAARSGRFASGHDL